MKTRITFLFLFLVIQMADAQSGADLNINMVRARINPGGDLFWDFANAQYEVPKGKGVNAIFASNLWIGGLDAGGALHVAAQTYRQHGTDYFYGPYMDSIAYTSGGQGNYYNQVWKINKTTIDSFRSWYINPTGYPGYTVPNIFYSWPAFTNASFGTVHPLAPFVDVNGDGQYDPSAGDYPCIPGDQAIFFVYNDNALHHGESGAAALGVEIQGMAYEFHNSADSALNYTVFVNYKIINSSSNIYHNSFIGSWTDTDIGYYKDDFEGCDVGRSAYYGYNGTSCDSTGTAGTYGCHPPAQAIVMMQGPLADFNDGIDNNHNGVVDEPGETWNMSRFLFYNNTFNPVNGNPRSGSAYYNYMQGMWGDGSSLIYGGNGVGSGQVCDYMYPGNSDPTGWGTNKLTLPPWTEATAGNTPGDRRGLGSYGPLTMQPGEVYTVSQAYVWARDYVNPSSIGKLQTYIDSVKSFYVQKNLGGNCAASKFGPAGVPSLAKDRNVTIYPNPASDILYIDFGQEPGVAEAEILDISGRRLGVFPVLALHNPIPVAEWASGLYFIKVYGSGWNSMRKFIKK